MVYSKKKANAPKKGVNNSHFGVDPFSDVSKMFVFYEIAFPEDAFIHFNPFIDAYQKTDTFLEPYLSDLYWLQLLLDFFYGRHTALKTSCSEEQLKSKRLSLETKKTQKGENQ